MAKIITGEDMAVATPLAYGSAGSQLVAVDIATPLPVAPAPATATARLLSAAASTNATNVKATPGTVLHVMGYNAAASARFLKLYDKASAPTVGTDVPRKTVYLPATASFSFTFNGAYALGIGFALTGAAADADATNLTAGDVLCLNIDYI